jgi:hypothetical protein
MAFSDFRQVRRACHDVGITTPTTTDLPRLPAPPFQRAVPITPVDRDGCACRLLPHSLGPSPNSSRVGVHKFPFEACSGFTRVTARWIAQSPNGDLCHEASTRTVTRPSRSSATRSTDNSLDGTYLHWRYAPSGRTTVEKVSDRRLWNQNAQQTNPAGRSLESILSVGC